MKKTLLRRSLAWLLVLVMMLSAVPFGVFAEDTSQADGTSQAQPEEETEDAKKAAEEEAAKKAAEEEAAKAAQEAAAKNASAERVKNVQDMINALPASDAISSDTRSETEAALTAIDNAKAQLTEEERAALDFAKYNAAAAALSALDGTSGAEVPKTLEEYGFPTKEELVDSLVIYNEDPSWEDNGKHLEETSPGSGLLKAVVKSNIRGFWFTDGTNNWAPDEYNGRILKYSLRGYYCFFPLDHLDVPTLIVLDIRNYNQDDTSEMIVYLAPFTVTFDAQGGSDVGTLTTDTEGKLANLPTPTREGYTFDGWYSSGTKLNTDHVYYSDTTVYAKWTPIACTVSFDSNGGPTAAPMTTGTDGKLASLPDLTMTYYTFGGWYLDRECTGTAVDTDYVYTADATLYAKWTLTTDVQAMIDALPDADAVTAENWKDAQKELDKVSAVLNELLPADRNALDMTRYNALSQAVDAQEEQEKKRPPTKAELPTAIEIIGSATTTGWDKGTPLRETAEGSGILAVVMDMGVGEFKLRKNGSWDFAWGGETATTVSERATTLSTRAGSANLIIENAGRYCVYVDTRSYNETDGSGLTLWLASADLPYTVAFDSNGGSKIPGPQQTDDTGRLAALPDPGKKPGYAFDGWYWGDAKVDEKTLYIADTGLTARWTPASYTVTFDSNGGSAAMPMVTGEDGKLASLPNPTRTGYTFEGWYLNRECTGTAVDADHVYTDDATLYAKWIPITYTVTFDGNGGRVKNSILASQNVPAEYDAQVTPPEFVKDYYDLTAWARDPEGADKVSTPIKNLTTQEGDRITLYAVWTYAPRTVTFDAQGGTVTENDAKLASVTRTTQEAPINTLKATDLPVPDSRDGWYFGGWYTQKDGKGDLVKAGSTEFKTDSTVYAYWIAFEPVTVTLKCQRGSMTVDGKTVTTGTMQTKWPGVLDGTLPTPSRSGYKFQGWYTAAGIKADEDTLFLKDTTLYARWTSAVSRTGNPKTGDQARLGLAVGILAAAAIGLTATVVIRKRKK